MKVMYRLLLFFLPFLFFTKTSAQYHDQRYLDGELYLKVSNIFPDTLTLNSAALLPLRALYHMDTCYRPFAGLGNDTLDRIYRLRFSDTAKTERCRDTLRTLGIIDWVEQVPCHRTSFVPNDISANQWHLLKIAAESAWDISQGSSSVVIAILDNGIRLSHQDLNANLWINAGETPGNGFDDDLNGYTDDRNGYDVADNDGDPSPPTGISTTDGFNHGTHCAGIASAVTNNGTGIASIGFNTRIMAVKCTKNSEDGKIISAADDGIAYAIRNNANVISMSFGSFQSSTTEQFLIATAHGKGITIVAAAGNEDTIAPEYPASYSGVISVGATDQQDKKTSFSNFGPTVSVMAPGLGIYSTIASSNSDYGTFSGTSMSTPLVAGLAALVIATNPSFSADQVKARIQSSADNINSLNPNYNGQLGSGRINADRALGGTGASAIAEVNEHGDISIYPNPFNNYITAMQTTNGAIQFEWWDLQGRLLKSTNTTGEKVVVEAPTLPAGTYLLKITASDKIIYRRMVKL